MNVVTHSRLAPRRSAAGATWWSKAVLRAVEEAAFSQGELRRGRSLARGGDVGGITVAEGSAVAAVHERDDTFTVTISIPTLDDVAAAAFVEVVAAESGRVGALLAGQLPHPFVEAIEETGVELLPYGGEIGATCTCEAWLDPCPHALAVLTQLAWLIQDDPFVLTHLRGLARDVVLQRLHEVTSRFADDGSSAGHGEPDRADEDLAVAAEAADRAVRALELLQQGRSDEVAF